MKYSAPICSKNASKCWNNAQFFYPIIIPEIIWDNSLIPISQLVENIPLNKFILKFCSNLLEASRVILKVLLGLVIPNQYCQGARMVLWSWFLGDSFGQKNPNLHDP